MSAVETKERPIIFSAKMITAIREGRKTQTRRVIKPQPRVWEHNEYFLTWKVDDEPLTLSHLIAECPYGRVGQSLWTRETHYRWTGCGPAPADWMRSPSGDRYQSRGYVGVPEHDELHREAAAAVTVPSIHMPRWASRDNLEILEIRIEQVQDISEYDAKAEGISEPAPVHGSWCDPAKGRAGHWSYRKPYAELWDTINSARKGCSWADNPWVWVLEFRRCRGIDPRVNLLTLPTIDPRVTTTIEGR